MCRMKCERWSGCRSWYPRELDGGVPPDVQPCGKTSDHSSLSPMLARSEQNVLTEPHASRMHDSGGDGGCTRTSNGGMS